MKSINTYYTDFPSLVSFIQSSKIVDSPSLLIQIFTAHNDKKYIADLLENLTHLLPKAVIIGSTTDGEIMAGEVSTGQTVLSFTSFEATTLEVALVEHKEDGFCSGKHIGEKLMGKETKLIIAFADGLHTNGDAFLSGLNSVDNTIMVAGGLAGDNATFTNTFVFDKKRIIAKGAVAVALNSSVLSVNNAYNFNWRRIGKALTITKVTGNRVYTIDDRTAVDTYIHYLGQEMFEGLPAVGIEFPLITVRNGIKVARAVLVKHEDGSLSFAGNFEKGDKVQFGYGDPKEIMEQSKEMQSWLEEHPPECTFVYSCMARRHFMPDIIEAETLPLNDIAPVSGFFTYGEFFTSDKKELLNQSMTLVTLSETSDKLRHRMHCVHETNTLLNTSTNALINLINVTSNEAMEQEVMKQAHSTFETLFEQSPDAILLMEGNQFIQGNQQVVNMFGYESEEALLSAKPLKLFPKKQPSGEYSLEKIYRMKERAIKEGNQQFEWVFKRQNGDTFWADIMLTSMSINQKEIIYLVCRDISTRKEMELELARQKNVLYYRANHDTLTGLPNRTLFMSELVKGLELAKRYEEELVLMFIDLDRFKKINDSLGHNIGDRVISIVGERLKLVVDKDDIVARLGGDEFLVLMKDVKKHDDILNTASKILKIIKQPIAIEHYTLYSSASIGISRYPTDDISAENLLKYADTAMYKAKEEGGNNYQFYTREMTDIAYEHVMMERDLREGIKQGHFEVFYQPQIHVKTGEILGLEALVRWNHPTVGLLSPDIFIPLSEKTGLIVELDLWVMKTAMEMVSSWYKEGLNPGTLALNVSMKQLEYPDLQKEILKNSKMFEFKSEWLELEITETEVMRNPDKVIQILDDLHRLGLAIAIDDFGTGYSSLSHLKRLPIDKLKIDKSFISDVPRDEVASAIVKTMIVLAQSLKINVIAEGVETQEQKEFLEKEGCEQIQGYYYSKPVSAKELKSMLLRQKG